MAVEFENAAQRSGVLYLAYGCGSAAAADALDPGFHFPVLLVRRCIRVGIVDVPIA